MQEDIECSIKGKISQAITLATINQIKKVADTHLLNTVQRDFLFWILDTENPLYKEYLQIIGLEEIVKMEMFVLTEVISNETFLALCPLLGILNAYFIFEIKSDDLAKRLAIPLEKANSKSETRKEVLIYFNDVIINKIDGNQNSAIDLLNKYKTKIDTISSFEQSLAPDELKKFAKEYVKLHKNASVHDLEYSTFSALVLNIETCLSVLKAIENHRLYSFIKETIIARYSSVNRLLQEQNLSLSSLIDLGNKTILTRPTLAYLIAALDDISPLKINTQEDLFKEISYTAAEILRLLNDIGTVPLSFSEEQLKKFNEDMLVFSKSMHFDSFKHFLTILASKKDLAICLSRPIKDNVNDEFNVCMDNIRDIKNVELAVQTFLDNINCYYKQYRNQKEKLEQLQKLFSNTIGKNIVLKFIQSHEVMYAKAFKAQGGDYAIPSPNLSRKKYNPKIFTELTGTHTTKPIHTHLDFTLPNKKSFTI